MPPGGGFKCNQQQQQPVTADEDLWVDVVTYDRTELLSLDECKKGMNSKKASDSWEMVSDQPSVTTGPRSKTGSISDS